MILSLFLSLSLSLSLSLPLSLSLSHTHTHTHTHIHTWLCTLTHTYAHSYAHTHTHTPVHSHTHLCTITHTYSHRQTNTFFLKDYWFHRLFHLDVFFAFADDWLPFYHTLDCCTVTLDLKATSFLPYIHATWKTTASWIQRYQICAHRTSASKDTAR